MKIIGGHDYYDGAGYGVDETLVFLRKEQDILETPFYLPEATTHRISARRKLSFHYVLVAGKAFPAIQEYREAQNWGEDSTTVWHYDEDAAQAALVDFQNSQDWPKWGVGIFRRLPDEITRHFRETKNPEWTKWMIENNVVTGLVSRDPNSARKAPASATVNIATLKDLQLFRVLDPATIHMEISNYLGGVLPSNPDTVEISDLDKVRKAGFDTKISFRQDPGVKKPRRKNKGHQ
jgi:hypothetical protein